MGAKLLLLFVGVFVCCSYAATYQDDKVTNKCDRSLVSGFSHKSDHMNGEPAKDQTEALQLYHRNTGSG